MVPKKKPRVDGPGGQDTDMAADVEGDAAPAEQADEAPLPHKAPLGGQLSGAQGGDGDASAFVEREQDTPIDVAQPSLSEAIGFHTHDTTLNVMIASNGGVLLPMNEGGLQHLLAGARANVGVRSGRYMFEVKIIEHLQQQEVDRHRVQAPRQVLRVGFSLEKTVPLMGDSEASVCFDVDGAVLFNKKRTAVCGKLGFEGIFAVVINLVEGSENANTMSLFKDGVRMAESQAIPPELLGRPLYPTVTWRNLALHVNFGDDPLMPLGFRCKTLQEATGIDVEVSSYTPPEDGKYRLILPTFLPDEGTFDWVDWFLEQNPHVTELSDRRIVEWAIRSGLVKPKSVLPTASNDRPHMNFGVATLDNSSSSGSVKNLLLTAASVQKRDLLIMEVKGNLLKTDRQELLKKFRLPHFRRHSLVVVGEPPDEWLERVRSLLFRDKQNKIDLEMVAKRAERERKKMIAQKLKQAELARRKAEALRKADLLQRMNEVPGQGTEEAEEPEQEEEMKEEVEESTPVATLSDAEKSMRFRKGLLPDMSPAMLHTSFGNFCLPGRDEGFEVIDYPWGNDAQAATRLGQWLQERKMSVRVENLQPSDWFKEKWISWQKELQKWHAKSLEFQDPARRSAALAAWKAQREPEVKDGDAKLEDAGNDENKPPTSNQEQSAAEDETVKDAMKLLEEELQRRELDVFACDSVEDNGSGEPLFVNFAFEDWVLLTLRFELHLLMHAFKHDCKDQDRTGFVTEHLPFYYNRYYKKTLNPKLFGVEHLEDVLELVRDTVTTCSKVLESQVDDDLETNEVFVKLTEEHRRQRQRRVDAGDGAARVIVAKAPAFTMAVPKPDTDSVPATVSKAAAAPPARTTLFPPGMTGKGYLKGDGGYQKGGNGWMVNGGAGYGDYDGAGGYGPGDGSGYGPGDYGGYGPGKGGGYDKGAWAGKDAYAKGGDGYAKGGDGGYKGWAPGYGKSTGLIRPGVVLQSKGYQQQAWGKGW